MECLAGRVSAVPDTAGCIASPVEEALLRMATMGQNRGLVIWQKAASIADLRLRITGESWHLFCVEDHCSGSRPSLVLS